MPRGFLTLVHLAPKIADLGVGGGATEASGGHGRQYARRRDA